MAPKNSPTSIKVIYSTNEKLNSLKDITTIIISTSSAPTKKIRRRMPNISPPVRGRQPSKAKSKSPRPYDIEELIKLAPFEERIYRLRCVEAWSMVIPWIGFPLSALIKLAEPTGNAKFIQFVTLKIPSGCRDKSRLFGTFSNGPTSKGCAWMKRCIR